jgi:hypothetical protein
VIAELAEAQDLVLRRDQLLERGVTSKEIEYRLRVKRLHRIHRGVYALRPRVFGRARYRAAVYACGDGAALSHRSGGNHLGLRLSAPARVEVTVPRGNGRRPRGVHVHESRSLPPEEVTVVDGIPCTTWARTIVDCAGILPERDTDRMIERSMILRVFDLNEMRATLIRASGRKGTSTIHSLLARFSEVPPTRSEFERLFLDLVRTLPIEQPVVNGLIGRYEVDFHWPAARLIIELDGRATHDTPYGWENDRERDLDLELSGWRVVRITWRQLTEQPQRVASLLLARLST